MTPATKIGRVSAHRWVHISEFNLKIEYYGMWHIKWKEYIESNSNIYDLMQNSKI